MICPCFKENIFDYRVKYELYSTSFTLIDSLITEEQLEGKKKLKLQEILDRRRIEDEKKKHKEITSQILP